MTMCRSELQDQCIYILKPKPSSSFAHQKPFGPESLYSGVFEHAGSVYKLIMRWLLNYDIRQLSWLLAIMP